MNNSTQNLQLFTYQGHQVRTVLINNEPWFVLVDLCEVLGLSTPGRVVERLDGWVSQTHPIPDSLGRQRETTIVSEPGLYEVIIRSDKPEAKKFRRWVTHEVLPMIRKTGSYSTRGQLSEDEIVHEALQITVRKVKELEAAIGELEPKARYVEQFVTGEDLLKFRHVASKLGVSEHELRQGLLARGWIYAESTTRWSNSRGVKVPVTRYSAYADKRQYFQPVMCHEAPRFKGEVMHTLKITPKGAQAISRLYKQTSFGQQRLQVVGR